MLEHRKTAAAFGEFLDANVYKVGYLIGTRGERATQAQIDSRLANTSYKSYWPKIPYAKKWLAGGVNDGAWVWADCMGWLEMFWNGGYYNRPLTKSQMQYPDTSTYLMYDLVRREGLPNGPIADLPKDCPYPIAVGYTGHVGFYYKGLVYQSAGHSSGTIRTYLTSTEHNKAWQYWYMIPYLDYMGWMPNEEGDDVIKYLEKSENVKLWQRALLDAGYDLAPYGADGSFGPLTATVTNKFKTDVGLPIDSPVTVTLVEWYAMQAYQKGNFNDCITQADLDAEKAKTAEAYKTIGILQDEIQGLKVSVASRQDDLISLKNIEKEKAEILARY